MGRTVINQTENKQTIILNDSSEGVEGGYFDADMVWHDLGGESESLLYPGVFTFSGGAELKIEGTKFSFKRNTSTSTVGFFPIIDTIFRNNPSTITAGNVQNLRGMYQLKAGDVIHVVVSNIAIETDGSSSNWASINGCVEDNNNKVFNVGLTPELEDKSEYITIENDVVMRTIYFSLGVHVVSFECDIELYINDRRIL